MKGWRRLRPTSCAGETGGELMSWGWRACLKRLSSWPMLARGCRGWQPLVYGRGSARSGKVSNWLDLTGASIYSPQVQSNHDLNPMIGLIQSRKLSGLATWVCCVMAPVAVEAQLSPGPYEILPYQDGFIIEAFKDLLAGTGIADWTGWSGSTWVSPDAYDEHIGTDVSVQTGTPLFVSAAG